MNLETVAAAAYGRWVELSVFAGFAQADDHLEWSQLPDHKTVSWFAVARALGTPEPYPDKTLTVELEDGPRAMMTAGGTPVVGPVNPDNKTVTLRRPTGKDLPRGVSFSLSDAWGTWAPLLVECSDRDRDEIERLTADDTALLVSALRTAFGPLEETLYEVWRLEHQKLLARESLEDLAPRDDDDDEHRRACVATLRHQLESLEDDALISVATETLKLHGKLDPGDAKPLEFTAPEVNPWCEVVFQAALGSDEHFAEVQLWHGVVTSMTKAEDGQLYTRSGVITVKRRRIECGDMRELSKHDSPMDQGLHLISRMCGVAVDELLKMDPGDVIRAVHWGTELLGKFKKKTGSKLGSWSRRRSAWRSQTAAQ